MAKEKAPQPAAEIRGLALVDLPDYKVKSGEFVSLPKPAASALEAIGHFDTKAKETP